MKLESDFIFGRSPRGSPSRTFVLERCSSSQPTSQSRPWSDRFRRGRRFTPLTGGCSSASRRWSYGATAYQKRRAAAARRELETSNQQLQVLSRVFRHNVRNDLNVIQGYTDLLAERVDDERSRECLETIRETTDDVVEISELRVIEDASPTPRVGESTSSRRFARLPRASTAQTSRSPSTRPAEAWVHADESIEYPIQEVFENAVTHNDDESVRRIDARVTENGSTACLEVSDNGPGIPADERQCCAPKRRRRCRTQAASGCGSSSGCARRKAERSDSRRPTTGRRSGFGSTRSTTAERESDDREGRTDPVCGPTRVL